MNVLQRVKRLNWYIGIFLVILLLPISFNGEMNKAEAQFIVNDPLNVIQTTLSALSAAALEQKELVLDGIFSGIAEQVLQQITNDIIKWVNSGFDGNPGFVTDLEGFLQDIADDIAGDIIYGELDSLCEPFQLDTTVALTEDHQLQNYGEVSDQIACTADQYSNDYGAFIEGDFYAGGWSAWFEVVLNPQNTPIGAKLAVKDIIDKETEKKQEIEKEYLRYGDGFFSKMVCDGPKGEEKCTVTTPGKVIADLASFAPQIPILRLIQGDEINEIIGSLFSNLANQALSGVNGFLGLGGNATFSNNSFGASGSLSYLDAISEETAERNSGGQTGGKIEQALKIESRILELQLGIINIIDSLTEDYNDAREPFEDDSCWDLVIPVAIEDKLEELLEEVPGTIETVVALEALTKAFEEADSTQEELNVLTEFSGLQSSGKIGGQASVIKYEYYLNNELKTLVREFAEDLEDQVDSCE